MKQLYGADQNRLGKFGITTSKNVRPNSSKRPLPPQPKPPVHRDGELIGHTRYFMCPDCGHMKSEKELMTPSDLIIEHLDMKTGNVITEKIIDSFKPESVEETLWRYCCKCKIETIYQELDDKNEKTNEKTKTGEKIMTDEKTNEVNLESTGEVEMEAIEVDQYIGKDVSIENVTEHKGEYGYYVKVQTAVVDTLESGKDLRASRIFGLMTGKDKKVGWTSNSKMGLYLKKMGVAHYKDLKGKMVKIQTQQGTDGNTYMTF